MTIAVPEPSPATPRERVWPQALLCALAVGLCYANSLTGPFQFDDLSPGARSWSATRPVVSASFELNRRLSGEATWSYHAFNLLVHAGAGCLLLGLLRRTIRHAAPALAARTRAGLALTATLVWLVHPLQTQAVAYISQRAESLASLFYLGLLYAFLRSTASPRPRAWQALALVSFALGMASKQIVATAPAVLWLLDAAFLSGGPLRALRARAGFYASLALAWAALSGLLILPSLSIERSSAGFGLHNFTALEYARTQPAVILHYLRLALWPHSLVFDYGWPVARGPWEWLPQTLAVAALLGATAWLLLRRSWPGFALACAFLLLAPTSSFLPIKDLAVEHRVYLALAGWIVPAVVGAWWLCARWLPRTRGLPRALALAVLLALSAATIARNRDYRSALRLWRTVTERAPWNDRGHVYVGLALLEEERIDEAIAAFEEALRRNPGSGHAYQNLGSAYLRRGDRERAMGYFSQAVAHSDEPFFHDHYAQLLFEGGDFARAEFHFRHALEQEPGNAAYHYRLATALARLERPAEALQHYEAALRLDDGLQNAHTNLAALLSAGGRHAEALPHYRRALEIPPDSPEETLNLGQCLAALGYIDEARTTLMEVARLAPAMPEPYAVLARALNALAETTPEQRQEALGLAQKANQLARSRRPDLLEILAVALAATGDYERAAVRAEEALALPGPQANPVFAERLRGRLAEYRAAIGAR